MQSRLVYVAIATAVMLSLVASYGSPPSGAAPAKPDVTRGGTLAMSLGPDFVTFDPWYDVNAYEFRSTIYEAPIRPNKEGTKYEPWLAEKVEESSDGLSVTLYMRKGVRFHNGRELTADDVVWSVNRAMDSKIGHHLNDRFKLATGVTKIDTYTAKITYKERDPSKYVGINNLFLYPKEAAQNIAKKPVGTGPFKFDEWVPGDHLALSRFTGYWRKGVPYLDRIIVKPFPDEQSRIVNLQGGAIQLLMGLPLGDATRLSTTKGFGVYTPNPGTSFYAIIINVSRAPFDDPRVRQAMHYAVDRDKINRVVFHGLGTMASIPYTKASWAYDEGVARTYRYDPARAKQLLAEAGYPNGITTEILIRGTSGPHVSIPQVYQQDLAKAGIQARLVPTELPQYWPKLFASNFWVVSHATGETDLDPNGLFIGAACCRPFRNFFKITENKEWFPAYRDMIYKARDASDQATRKKLYRELLTTMQQQAWLIPIAWRQEWFAYRDTLKGFRMDSYAHIWLDEAWLAR